MNISFPFTCRGILSDNESSGTLKFCSVTLPLLKQNELLVQVHAVGVNHADIEQAKGAYLPPPNAPKTLGLECAGVVVAKGDAVRKFNVGDRIMSLVSGGAYLVQRIYKRRIESWRNFSCSWRYKWCGICCYSNCKNDGSDSDCHSRIR